MKLPSIWTIHIVMSFMFHNNSVLLGASILGYKRGAENVQETSLVPMHTLAIIANVGYLCFTHLVFLYHP